MFDFKKKKSDTESEPIGPTGKTTETEFVKTTEYSTEEMDPSDAWKKEFGVDAASLERRGVSVGYMRFVAFHSDDEKTGTSMMIDLNGNPEFMKAFIGSLSTNDEVYEYLKRAMDEAESNRKFASMDISDMILEMFGKPSPSVRPTFPRGRMSFGELDELSDIGIPESLVDMLKMRKARRTSPIEELLKGLRGEEPRADKDFFKSNRERLVRVVSDALDKPGATFESIAEAFREATGGKGCDCDDCTALRKRLADEQAMEQTTKAMAEDKHENQPAENKASE